MTIVEKGVIVVILLIIASVVIPLTGLGIGILPNYSNGSRIGIVTKISEKGVFFKSWEGEMLMALPIAVAGTTTPEVFYFNTSRPGRIWPVDCVESDSTQSTL